MEPLESREMLSAVPARTEFRVNTTRTNDQFAPSVAASPLGNFVVVWTSDGQDGSLGGIYAQRYDAAGVRQGGEFRINQRTSGDQSFPQVAMDARGDFVVVWTDEAAGVFGRDDTFARRFNAAGQPLGNQFRVNSLTVGLQDSASVAMDAVGDFVITWQSTQADGQLDIHANRYNAAGTQLGSEFRVNGHTTGSQASPSVAADYKGDFAITWLDFDRNGVYARLYSAAGASLTSEIHVNAVPRAPQDFPAPSVAMDALGAFVITWAQSGDGSGQAVFAHRYDAAGAAQGGVFRVNTFTANDQRDPRAAMDALGDFVIAWSSFGEDGSGFGVYARSYNAAGTAQGGEFRVNTFTANWQRFPSVAMDARGDFVIVWQSLGQDGSGEGVYGQRYLAGSTTWAATTLDSSAAALDAAPEQTLDPHAVDRLDLEALLETLTTAGGDLAELQ